MRPAPKPHAIGGIQQQPTLRERSLLTVDEVAAYLRLKPETIRTMARRHTLPAVKVGKVWRFDESLIQHYLHHDLEVEKTDHESDGLAVIVPPGRDSEEDNS
jgi:excisionase family DNA binding protein